MTLPTKYANNYMPVKYFLSSYRALSDGRSGIRQLREKLQEASVMLSEWKVTWVGTCAILRTAVSLFGVDKKSCIQLRIREEIGAEWEAIKKHKNKHAIYHEFLLKERDEIVHRYQWRAYESWMKPDGTFRATKLSLLAMDDDGARPFLLMKGGHFDGRDSLDLLNEAADWVEARIFSAIERAGFDPEEHRGLVYFQPRPVLKGSILGEQL